MFALLQALYYYYFEYKYIGMGNTMDYMALFGLLKEYAETGIKKATKTNAWKKLFIETGDFIVQSPEVERRFAEDLKLVFSDKSMEQLAKDMSQGSGIGFTEKLHELLFDLFKKYELEVNAEQYPKARKDCIKEPAFGMAISYSSFELVETTFGVIWFCISRFFSLDTKKEKQKIFEKLYHVRTNMNSARIILYIACL